MTSDCRKQSSSPLVVCCLHHQRTTMTQRISNRLDLLERTISRLARFLEETREPKRVGPKASRAYGFRIEVRTPEAPAASMREVVEPNAQTAGSVRDRCVVAAVRRRGKLALKIEVRLRGLYNTDEGESQRADSASRLSLLWKTSSPRAIARSNVSIQ